MSSIFSLTPVYTQPKVSASFITRGFYQLNNLCQFLISNTCLSSNHEVKYPI